MEKVIWETSILLCSDELFEKERPFALFDPSKQLHILCKEFCKLSVIEEIYVNMKKEKNIKLQEIILQ